MFRRLMKGLAGLAVVALVAFSNNAAAQDALAVGVEQIAAELSEALAQREITSVAVPSFANERDEITPLGALAGEELAAALVSSDGSLRVIDRSAIQLIQEELALRTDGFVDPNDAAQIGRAAGVDALILGRLSRIGDQLRISVRAVSVADAEIVAAASYQGVSQETRLEVAMLADGVQVSSGRQFQESGLIWRLDRAVTPGNEDLTVFGTFFNGAELPVRVRITGVSASDQNGNICRISSNHLGFDVTGLIAGPQSAGSTVIPRQSERSFVLEIDCDGRFAGPESVYIEYVRAFEGDDSLEVMATIHNN